MNQAGFLDQLEHLDTSHWQALLDGASLVLKDDQDLSLGAPGAPNVIVHPLRFDARSALELRVTVLGMAGQIWEDYYRTHPLTPQGFNRQVETLMESRGPAAFAATPGSLPDFTLFVDSGTVVAEPKGSPRHRYGAYLELKRPLPPAQVIDRVRAWVKTGRAYERYQGMNACRYNC